MKKKKPMKFLIIKEISTNQNNEILFLHLLIWQSIGDTTGCLPSLLPCKQNHSYVFWLCIGSMFSVKVFPVPYLG